MKLIIDIPYEAYYTFKCDLEKGNLNALAEIVANGTPYEPKGDLISREALKTAITEHCRSETECLNHFWYDENIIALIDNAPTVEPRDNFDLGYVKGLEDGKDKLIKELWNCRNELCLRCGKYEKAHRGACDDCRYNFKNMEQYKRGDDK